MIIVRKLAFLVAAALPAAMVLLLAGCGEEPPAFRTDEQTLTPERMGKGLVIILPGIEGESLMNQDIRRGLLEAGIQRGITIHRWGSPIPGIGMVFNQTDVIGNRLAGKRVSDMVVAYQDTYPGMPVHVIGHSGGGGVAVFAAEAMPPGRKIDGIILLSASISTGYDTAKALANCKNGAVNVYCRSDVGLLVIGTTIMGNMDGVRGPGAGNGGFTQGHPNLYELELTPDMSSGDPHAAATRASFVSTYIAPWIAADRWPPTAGSPLASTPGTGKP